MELDAVSTRRRGAAALYPYRHMLILAEISDKMPTIGQHWLWVALPTVPLVLIALTDRRVALGVLPLAFGLSLLFGWAAYSEAWLEGSFSDLIWAELGGGWVINSLAASGLPTVAVGAVVVMHYRRWRFNARSASSAQAAA